ncbi:MAG: hypothetical protein RIS73_1320 [Bacteroidota bacterium]|jgi:hypothetical protein
MKYSLTGLAIFFSNLIYAQSNFGFTDVTIMKKKGDSVNCLIKLEINYGDIITYKDYQDAPEKKMDIKDIKSIRFPFKYLENITLDNKEKLVTLIDRGKISLYNYVEVKNGETVDVPKSGGGKFTPSKTIVHYIINVGTKYIELEENLFRENLKPFINDCSELNNKVDNNVYSFTDIVTIIKAYNSCKQ